MGSRNLMLRSLVPFALILGLAAGNYLTRTATNGAIYASPCDTCVANDDDRNFTYEKITCNGGSGNITIDRYTDAACTTASGESSSTYSYGANADIGTITYHSSSATFYVGAEYSSNSDDCPETGTDIS